MSNQATIGVDLLETRTEDAAASAHRAEERRQASIAIVTALYRLVKVYRLHVETNQAVRACVESAAVTTRDFKVWPPEVVPIA